MMDGLCYLLFCFTRRDGADAEIQITQFRSQVGESILNPLLAWISIRARLPPAIFIHGAKFQLESVTAFKMELLAMKN